MNIKEHKQIIIFNIDNDTLGMNLTLIKIKKLCMGIYEKFLFSNMFINIRKTVQSDLLCENVSQES